MKMDVIMIKMDNQMVGSSYTQEMMIMNIIMIKIVYMYQLILKMIILMMKEKMIRVMMN